MSFPGSGNPRRHGGGGNVQTPHRLRLLLGTDFFFLNRFKTNNLQQNKLAVLRQQTKACSEQAVLKLVLPSPFPGMKNVRDRRQNLPVPALPSCPPSQSRGRRKAPANSVRASLSHCILAWHLAVLTSCCSYQPQSPITGHNGKLQLVTNHKWKSLLPSSSKWGGG